MHAFPWGFLLRYAAKPGDASLASAPWGPEGLPSCFGPQLPFPITNLILSQRALRTIGTYGLSQWESDSRQKCQFGGKVLKGDHKTTELMWLLSSCGHQPERRLLEQRTFSAFVRFPTDVHCERWPGNIPHVWAPLHVFPHGVRPGSFLPHLQPNSVCSFIQQILTKWTFLLKSNQVKVQ